MRLRFRLAKLGKVRWTSHRDLARMWERACRRVELPLATSQGFSPRPRVSFGLALPTGAESVAEYLDAETAGDVDPGDLVALPGRLSAALPEGVDVLAAAVVTGTASLQHEVTSCTWEVELADVAADDLARMVDDALAAPALVIWRERKGRRADEDVRPGILACTVAGPVLTCELAAQPRTLRPSELLRAVGVDPDAARVRRTHQWIERDGARAEPLVLPPGATGAPHAVGRAS